MADEPSVRASERLKAIAQHAVSAEKVRAALATKLVAVGLALICFAGGLDYFSQGEEMNKTLAGIARDTGQGDLVADLEKVGGRWSAFKATVIAMLPDTLREYVVLLSLLPGMGVFAWGLRLKVGSGSREERGRTLWDLGRIVIGPGLIGALAFSVRAIKDFPVLRRTTSGFVDKIKNGTLTGADVGALTAKYHGWTWAEVGPVLVLGLLLCATAFVLGRLRRGGVAVDVVRRSAWSGAALSLGYYGSVTAVAVASYGAGLPVVTWPWKVRATTFLLTLGLMSVGGGIAWTGRALLRRPAEPAEGEAAAAAEEKGEKKKAKKA